MWVQSTNPGELEGDIGRAKQKELGSSAPVPHESPKSFLG